ncbi:MAG: hypothetical protein AB7G35_18760 [Hyphomicrobiaceae bacterium]
MGTESLAGRYVELAEDRLRAAEQLGLSAAGLFAHLLNAVADDDYAEAAEIPEQFDELINTARGRQESG